MDGQNSWPDPPPPLPLEPSEPDPTQPLNRPPVAGGYPYGTPPVEHVEHRVDRYTVAHDPAELTAAELRERREARRAYALIWVKQVVYLVLGVLETLLILRFALELLAANPDAAFSSFIYGLTGPFVLPFQGVFPTPGTHGSMLDLAAILAMVVYALLAWGITNTMFTLNHRRNNDLPVV